MAEKIKISEAALMKRINRALVAKGEKIKKARANIDELGQYYLIDNFGITGKHLDLDEVGRELGVLQNYEELDDG